MSSSSSFLDQIQQEWESNIQPIIEDVYGSITGIIQKTSHDPNLFRKCEPVDLYTHIYNMTVHHQFDFCHLDFLYNQEIQSIVVFCKKFKIHHLSEMNRQMMGFKILLKWFHVFFHHLNRFRHRAYYHSHSIEEDMVLTVRNHYLKPQEKVLSQLISSKWAKIRKNQYLTDKTLLDSMDLLYSFHPKYYNDLLFLYFKNLGDACQKKSEIWLSRSNPLSFMEKANHCFQQEKQMFCEYFTQQHDDLDEVHIILKKHFLYPYCDIFLQDAQCGWKALLRAHHVPDIQTAYQYFSWMDELSLWSLLYQQFLEECIATFSADNMVDPLASLLKQQVRLLDGVFIYEKLKIHFKTTLEKTIQKAMTDNTQNVIQLVKVIHHHINKKSSKQALKDVSALVAFCPEKDLLYNHYHHFLKSRLLLGRYYLPYEKMMLNIFRTKLGMSFVLNLSLMMEEIQSNRLSVGCYSLDKLSSVVWKLDKEKPLRYKIPIAVQTAVQKLHDKMKQDTKPSLQLEMLWFQGTVILTRNGTDFYMSPIQAIVLMALEEEKTREQLVLSLQIEDDVHHNLDGVLESLSKAMLIVKKAGDVWCWYTHSPQRHNITRIIVPPIKKPTTTQSDPEWQDILGPIVMHAFIVRTLKQEKRIRYFQLMDLVSKKYKARLVDVKQSIETLIEGEYLSRDEENNLHYVP